MYAWMRHLEVQLTSQLTGKVLSIQDFNIDITGKKMMSCLQDTFTIEIDNLDYSTIVRLIQEQYFDVKIIAGYESSNISTIFNGAVLYIWNKLNNDRTGTCRILCGSQLVGKYSQRRITLSMNSGINMYTALKYMLRMAANEKAINSKIDSDLMNRIMGIVNVNQTVGSWIDDLCKANPELIVNADAIDNSVVTMYNAVHSSGRTWQLRTTDIILTQGYPRMTKDGSTITLLPTVPISPGDVVKIDNSVFNVDGTSLNDITNAYYLDTDGKYTVYQISYHLQNRGTTFTMELQVKPRSKLLEYIGARTDG